MSRPIRVVLSSLVAMTFVGVGALGCGSATDRLDSERATAEQALGSCALQPLAFASATASGVEANHFLASWAIDGDPTTRWSSTQGAPEWLRLDLGTRSFVDTLKIDWQTAFSPKYEIQVSDNGTNWAPVRKVTTTTGGHQEITGLAVDARYVRIYCNQMSAYGSVSIYEVQAIGSADPACSATSTTCGDSVRIAPALAQASSTEFSYTPASAAIDDVYSTRWSSAHADNQWLALDLGSAVRVDKVRITWETAYAKSYAIESASSMSGPWSQIALVTSGAGGVETVAVGTTTRYLRLNAITRATSWGFSIWEMTVLGSTDTSCGDNLLTRGWDETGHCTLGADAGCLSSYVLDPARPNFIGFVGGGFCTGDPVSYGPTVHQAVTATQAGTKYRFSLEVASFSGFTSGSCPAYGSTTFVATLGGVAATSYTPSTPIYGDARGCVTGSGNLNVDFDVPFAAGETRELALEVHPISFGIGNCGGWAETFDVINAKLVRIQ